jgi:hypothetical protein
MTGREWQDRIKVSTSMLAELALSCVAAISVVTSTPPPGSGPAKATDDDVASPARSPAAAIAPRKTPAKTAAESPGVHWEKLGRDSVRFLAIMQGFRWATEPGTRSGGFGLGEGYLRSAGNLHGWADGDPFYVNYVGHPMQGAVSGRLFLLNDPRYDRTEFGRSPEYWKAKLRAAAFAWAFSEQFEIGPLSEASIGHIQADFPQQGFVDHVVTPTVGLAWMLGEDSLDRYVIRPIEDRIMNRWVRLALRSGLNPARTFANVLDGRVPWYRASRAGILTYQRPPADPVTPGSADRAAPPGDPKPAPFEFAMTPVFRDFGGGGCAGGGAEAAYRLAPEVQVVLSVNGCKLVGLQKNLSGDALVYQIGPRWTPVPTGRWSPYAHFLVGGIKVTHEQFYPDKKAAVLEANQDLDPSLAYTLHDQYTRSEESSGVALSAGTGVDYKLNEALALRVVSVEYLRSSAGTLGGLPYGKGLQVTMGMVLRLGTW